MSAARREQLLTDPSRHSAFDILTALGTDEHVGLSDNEARTRLLVSGVSGNVRRR
jgi:hypothetical protein